jgi:hypothetical protein
MHILWFYFKPQKISDFQVEFNLKEVKKGLLTGLHKLQLNLSLI